MAALVFHKLFFPELSPIAGTIASFATFSVGFLARPLGGLIFGHYGDRVGRKAMLVASLTLMGGATFCMGVLPTYASIGLTAPVALTILRLLQGLALGGEWSGAASLAVEHAPSDRRGYYGGWVQYGGIIGPLLSTATVLVLSTSLSQEEFYSWGWRMPFLLSGALVAVGLFVRLRIEETPIFREVLREEATNRFPIVTVFRTQWRSITLVGGMHLANTTISYTVAVFMLSYATTTVGIPRDTVLLAMLIMGSIGALIALPLGALGDRVGRHRVYLTGTLGLVVVAFPMFWLVDTGELQWIALGLILGNAANALMYMTQGAFFTELFTANVRCTGAGMGVQLATVIAGGSAPLAAASLLALSGGNPALVSLYLVAIGLLSTAATLMTRKITSPRPKPEGSTIEANAL